MKQSRWQQIETIYNEALERPTEERSRFLSERCAGDEELYEEVESLLSSNDQADSFLAETEFDLGLQILIKPKHIFNSGQEFGHYKILKFLGRGGMGEVYLAQDFRLGRLVALKVLSIDLASNRERIRRFIQEARAASALNHPNILTIHEIGESDGSHFIASEFVEGETLRDLLKRKEPLNLPEMVKIALQIAEALNAAHKAGFIHRDIKPENVMIREDGLVKVLDFGLAKLMENPAPENSTDDFLSTNPGLVMGTVVYMSPEQARGRKVDARSDIWSLGVVLYEMLAGRLPFEGETTSDIIAAILTVEPDLPDENLTEKPHDLWQIAGKALRKDADERYQSVTEMADDLRKLRFDDNSFPERYFYKETNFKQIGQTDSKSVSTAETDPRHSADKTEKTGNKTKTTVTAALILLFALAGGWTGFYFLKDSGWFSPKPLKIARILDTGKTVTAAVSPDGKYVVHSVADAGKQSIWVKHLATNSNIQIVEPQSVDYPALTFSKDGDYIYYVQNSGELYQVPVLGGDPKKILAGVNSAISFSPDGQRFTFVRSLSADETAVMIVNADGADERQIAIRKKPEFFVGPAWSPDGKVIACSIGYVSGDQSANIAEIPVEGGSERLVSTQKWRAIWQVTWLSDGSGLVAPAASGEPGNDSQPIWFFPVSGGEARQITNDLNNYGDVSLTADSGTMVTIRFEQRTNIWLLPQGKTEEARMVSNNVHSLYRFIAWTPDGRIVYPSQENSDDGRNIWMMNADGSGAKQLTSAGDNILPCASSDGRYIVFASNRGDSKSYHLWRINTDGTNPVQLTNGGGERAPACSPDGKTVYYSSGGPDVGIEKSRLWKVSIDGGEAVQLTDYPAGWKDVSPDGNFVAIRFKADARTLKLGIMTPSGGQPVKVFDLKENSQLRWKPDSRSITYIKDSNIWEQPLSGEPPRPITKFTAETIYFFDWSKEGDLICTRGYQARDPVLISNFR